MRDAFSNPPRSIMGLIYIVEMANYRFERSCLLGNQSGPPALSKTPRLSRRCLRLWRLRP